MLPKISHPIFNISIPSTKKAIKFRPFLVKEEKILLIAKTSGKPDDILLAVKQIVNNCAVDTDFNVDNISIFDLEYVYLKIYSNSVNNKIKASYRDSHDDKIYNFEVNIDDVEIIFPVDIDKKIQVSKNVIMTLKYPPASLYNDKEFFNSDNETESLFDLIVKSIDKLYDGTNVYDPSTYSKEDIIEWIDSNLDTRAFDKIKKFLDNLPYISYNIKYKNSLGEDRNIDLSNLMDFFYFL